MVHLLVRLLLGLASCDTSRDFGLVVTAPAEIEKSVRVIVSLTGRSTADMVRVPVGGGSVTVFAAIFRSAPNRGLRSRPSCVRHTNFSLAAGVEWVGNQHHAVHHRPFPMAGDRPVFFASFLPR